MKHMWRVAFAMLLLGMLVVIPAGPAAAITTYSACATAGTSLTNTASGNCTVHLTNDNVAELSGVDVQVNWVNSGAATKYEVQYISGGPAGANAKNIPVFAFNFTDGTITVGNGGFLDPWTQSASPPPVDGFGSFLTIMERQDLGETFGVVSPMSFTMSGTTKALSMAQNDLSHHAHFAVHLKYDNGCSGFISDGSTTSVGSNANCAAIPEPGTLALVGSGLVGLGTIVRKRFFSGRRELE